MVDHVTLDRTSDAGPDVAKWTVSQTALAQLFGVTTRTIQRWQDEGLPHHQEAGRRTIYPLRECIAWAKDRIRRLQ